jgi:hypothetical protein
MPSRSRSILALATGSLVCGTRGNASVLPFDFAPNFPALQATLVAHTAEQLADDPSLADYFTCDIQIVVSSASGQDRFSSADMRGVFTNNHKVYIPPSNDANFLQSPGIRNQPGTRFLQMDTFVNCPVFNATRGTILGKSTFAPTSQSGEVFPSNGSNFFDPNDPNGTAFMPANSMTIIDVAWGDPQAPSRADAADGTFTIARITMPNSASGLESVLVRMGSTLTPSQPVTATYWLGYFPEPGSSTMLACAIGAICLRRTKR